MSACWNSRVVSRTRARSTGTLVEVIDNRDGSFDAGDPNGWFTVCVEHGGVCSHETRALALAWKAEPEMWCEGCRA